MACIWFELVGWLCIGNGPMVWRWTMTKITRTYEHRTFGAIGEVTLEVDGGAWLLGGEALPQSSVEHLMMFALQTLQDAYAGAKDAAEAKALWAKKRDKLATGGIGVRSAGPGVGEETKIWRVVAGRAIRHVAPDKWKVMKDDADAIDAFVEKNRAKLQPFFDEEIASRKRKAALLDSIEL